jgi:hypothetical protein
MRLEVVSPVPAAGRSEFVDERPVFVWGLDALTE